MNFELNRAGRRSLHKYGVLRTAAKGLCGLNKKPDGTYTATLPHVRDGESYIVVGEVRHQGKFVADLVRPHKLNKAIKRHERFLARS